MKKPFVVKGINHDVTVNNKKCKCKMPKWKSKANTSLLSSPDEYTKHVMQWSQTFYNINITSDFRSSRQYALNDTIIR